MIEHGPTTAEIAIEAARIKTQLDAAVAQAASRQNAGLAGALYSSIARRQVFRSPEQERELTLALLAQVTPERIRVAFRNIRKEAIRTVVTVAGKDSLGTDGDRLVKEAFTTAWSATVAAPENHATAAWAYPVSTTYTGPVPTRAEGAEWTIGSANGIGLTVKRTDFQPGRVSIRVRLPIRTTPREAGLAELIGRALADGGLGKHTATELSEVLANTTANISGIAIQDSALVIDGGCRPDHLQQTFELIHAWLTDAAWRPEAETRAKTAWYEALEAEKTEVDAITGRKLGELLYPEQAWRHSPTREIAEKASFSAARAWLEPLLRSAPLDVTIVGDVDEEKAMRIAASVLGSTTRPAVVAAATPEAARAALPDNPAMPTGEHRVEVDNKVAKAQILVMWPTDDQYDIKRTRRLGLLGGVFNELIRQVIREKFGDAYSPRAFSSVGDEWRGQGMLMAVVSVAPDRIDAARDAALGIATDLQAGISDQVLTQVRTPILKGVAEQRRKNGWWLGTLARAPEQPFRLAWQATIEQDIASITTQELVTLAKQYLVREKALIVIGFSKGKEAAKPTP